MSKSVRKLAGNEVVTFLAGRYFQAKVDWDFIAHLTMVKMWQIKTCCHNEYVILPVQEK